MRQMTFKFFFNPKVKPFFIILLYSLIGAVPLKSISEELKDKSKIPKQIKITSQHVSSLLFFPERNAPAKVESLNHSRIPAQINAILEQLKVKVGQQFNKGELLARLNCENTILALANRQALHQKASDQFEFQRRQLKRGQKLTKKKTIGEAELDKLKTNLAIATSQLSAELSQLKTAQLNQKHCLIRAPFKGVITQRIASEGEMLSIGSPIIEAVETDSIEVSADISLTDALSFDKSVEFYFESNGARYPLTKRVLLPVVINQTRSRQARLDFTSKTAYVGITGRVIWLTPEQHLPANLLQTRKGKHGIFIVETNKAKFIEIEGAQEGRPIKLTNPHFWKNKDLIIDGRHGLVDGQIVIIEPNKNIQSNKNEKLRSNRNAPRGSIQ